MSLDLLIENARIVDVVLQRTCSGWVGIEGGIFRFVEPGEPPPGVESAARLDAHGEFLQPGLIDVHMHIESSLLTPGHFAEAVLPLGTTAILQDPHEVGNVLGAAGVEFMIEASKGLPLRIFSAIPSCVPTTSAEIETPNARIEAEDVAFLARHPGVVALGEMMDYRGLLSQDERLKAILEAGRQGNLSLEGHVPTLTGMDLSAYIAHGIRSDHTLMTPGKVSEELSKGLFVMLQEKSITAEVIALVKGLADRSRVLLITDDVMPNRLVSGHLDRVLQLAVEEGWPMLDALASATIRPAMYLGRHDLGLIAPGYCADFALYAELGSFPPNAVYVDGNRVAESGRALFDAPNVKLEEHLRLSSSVGNAPKRVTPDSFRFSGGDDDFVARVISVNDVNTFTSLEEEEVRIRNGIPANGDIAVATVISRAALMAGDVERPILTLVKGLNLTSGAYATSFSHDSHNVFVLGRTADEMADAVNAVIDADGGMAVVGAENTVMPLPIAGVLSDEPLNVVAQQFDDLENALRALGMTHRNPVLMLTILPLTVSPAYKISDLGLVDVENQTVVPVRV